MRQKLIYIIAIIFTFQLGLEGQSMNAYINAADKAYEQKDFYSALEFYNRALEFDSSRIDIRYDIAQSARQFNSYTKGIEAYEVVLAADTISAYPEAAFWLGELYQKVGNYIESIEKYRLYLSEYSGRNAYLTKKSNIEIESSIWAQDELNNNDNGITIEHLGSDVNTSYSEFGAIEFDTSLFYTSMRFEEKGGKRNPKRLISKILEQGPVGNPTQIKGDINNSNLSVAHTAFNTDKSIVYYTICDYITDSDLKCDIYSREVNSEGYFVNPVKLSFNEGADSITYTQPTVGFDKRRNQEFMVFSSNREGSKGKLDLWQVDILANNQFGEIKALEKINTIEDDITPYFHNGSNILYYSSNGKIGLGGFDIYSGDLIDGEFYGSYNLGLPINSSFNDIYYVSNADEKGAYLSSNRTGSYYIDELNEACCFDIYKVEILNPILDLNVLTFDRLTTDSLTGTTVKLIDPSTGLILEEVTNLDDINHNFDLRKGRDYIIVTERSGFNPDTMTLATRGSFPGGKITKKVYLTTDRILLDANTFDKESLANLDGTTLRIIDRGNGEVVYEGTNTFSNNFKVYLDKNKKYDITASKEDYTEETIFLDLTQPLTSQIVKRKIYLQRIDIGDYLPLVLYFDNDRPDPGSRDLYTPMAYSDVFNDYYTKKETFKKRYAASKNARNISDEDSSLENFFEMEVKGGYAALVDFLNILETYLDAGKTANISIKGYTSPLAANRYNLALGQRRVSSIKNELSRFKVGVFMPFIESGQLSITDISFGEELSPNAVSDKSNDKPNSIYSVEASRERRVEIVRIKIN